MITCVCACVYTYVWMYMYVRVSCVRVRTAYMPKRKPSPVHRSFYSELPENSFKVICTVVGITTRSFFTNIFENIKLYNSRSNDLTNKRNLNYLRDCYIYRNESIILLYINCYRNVCCSHKCVIKNMFYKRSVLRLIDRIIEENVCSFTMISDNVYCMLIHGLPRI